MPSSSSSSSFHDDLLALLPRLRVQALALTCSRSDADDLLHDAVVNILAGQGGFTPGTNFAAWAHRILRNRFLSLVRRRRGAVGVEDIPPPAVAGARGDHLAVQELQRALARLPAEQREALCMVALQGIRYDEVAAATGAALGAAESRVFHARRFLHAWLEGDGGASRSGGPHPRARPDACSTKRGRVRLPRAMPARSGRRRSRPGPARSMIAPRRQRDTPPWPSPTTCPGATTRPSWSRGRGSRRHPRIPRAAAPPSHS